MSDAWPRRSARLAQRAAAIGRPNYKTGAKRAADEPAPAAKRVPAAAERDVKAWAYKRLVAELGKFTRAAGRLDAALDAPPAKPAAPAPAKPAPAHGVPRIVLNVRTGRTGGRPIHVHAWLSSTVRQLKGCIEAATGVPATHQHLIFGGGGLTTERTLEDACMLVDCGLTDGSTLYLMPAEHAADAAAAPAAPGRDAFMKLVVHFVDNAAEWLIFVPPTATVEQLKELVAVPSSIPVAQQRLILHGKCLADERTLAHYDVTDGTKIFLLLAARGD